MAANKETPKYFISTTMFGDSAEYRSELSPSNKRDRLIMDYNIVPEKIIYVQVAAI
jgi:hypothetical protein